MRDGREDELRDYMKRGCQTQDGGVQGGLLSQEEVSNSRLFILRQININESIKFWEDAAAEN